MIHWKSAEPRIASNRTPRRINSSLVLNTIRKRGEISRVDLARVSGLLPSTVTLIVEDLLADGWLVEGEAVKGAMGRRPRMLTLSNGRCAIGVDIHPRRSSLAVVDLSGRILERIELNLSLSPPHAIRQIIQAIRHTMAQQPELTFEGVGICLPGRTDSSAKDLIYAPNLRWPLTRLKSRIEDATGLRVEMDNVANACVLLEVWNIGSDHAPDLVVVEVSEGLGTGLFINGTIVRGMRGMAGEFGHVQLQDDGPPCNCGIRGCWETMASNRATLRYYREAGGRARNISLGAILELAAKRDDIALTALKRTAGYLGRGLQMIALALAPAEIIIVGDITTAWSVLEETLLATLCEHPLARTVRVRPAHDGGTARLRCAVPLLLADRFIRGNQVD
jgi:predicted NBD/HSP70 family sugar kinase